MCHEIDPHAKAPRRKVAWKVVDKYGGSLHSKWNIGRSTIYKKGKVVKAIGLGNNGHVMGTCSAAGIYVYLKKADAMYRRQGSEKVIEVSIAKEDWLTTSLNGQYATYRKVRV
jgi:hypothetical protein